MYISVSHTNGGSLKNTIGVVMNCLVGIALQFIKVLEVLVLQTTTLEMETKRLIRIFLLDICIYILPISVYCIHCT